MIGMGDHPRVCGEHCGEHSASFGVLGSSPRMRGTHSRCRRAANVTGIIPAYAGNTMMTPRLTTATWDHPRVCGEHPLWLSRSRFGVGSSPRMRGTLCRCCRTRFRLGIIPAYVGNTVRLTFAWPETWDHPRVCGEHATGASTQVNCTGSSPRMRGTLQPHAGKVGKRGIIPAYAGNTSRASSVSDFHGDHPRVCGEHSAA